MELKIRSFCEQDVEFALIQTAREGWQNSHATFQVCLAHDPDGCFVAEIGGQPAGIITTTCYARSAWVGNLIVSPPFRRKGVGRRLMVHALDRLGALGIRTVWLEADPMGLGLYEQLGFVRHFESPRFVKGPTGMAGRSAADRLLPSDVEAIKALDKKCFGDDRGQALEEFLRISKAAYCVRAAGRLVGYAMALPTSVGIRFGPCVVDRPEYAGHLLDAVLLDCSDCDIIVAVPGANDSAIRLIESRGFRDSPSSLRMSRGEILAIGVPDSVVAMADGATG